MRVGRKPLTPWLFLAPTLLVFGAFFLWPMVRTGLLAFTDSTSLGTGSFTGLENFRRMVGDPEFRAALWHSVLYMLVVVPANVVLPLLLALLVNAQLPGIAFFRGAFFLPVVASTVAVGLIWQWLLRANGLVNWVLQSLHVVADPVGFLTNEQLARFSVMLVTVWSGLGYYMIIYLAGLQNVPRELLDAATVDGAGPLRRTWSIVVPLLRPTIVLVAVLSAINAAKVFTEVYVVTRGGPANATETLVLYIYKKGITGLEQGYASAISLVLFVLVLAFSVLSARRVRRQAEAGLG
jgi:multiple sugar transport system permease protein